MAFIGLQHLVIAKLTETLGQPPAYSEGYRPAFLVSANAKLNKTDNKFYADDRVVEYISEVVDGTIDLALDDMDDETYRFMLGHTLDTDGSLMFKTGDTAPLLGVGMVKVRVKNGAKSFTAVWFPKVKFSEPDLDSQTKQETITFGTPTLSGAVMSLEDGLWQATKTFSIGEGESETDAIGTAIEWLEAKAGISDDSGAGQ